MIALNPGRANPRAKPEYHGRELIRFLFFGVGLLAIAPVRVWQIRGQQSCSDGAKTYHS
ncbi:hypothetical protein J0895_01890 [Phormidium pseudopriestleyi FRX01]|uniref:Uncharacterized protein n=1 Tax=Phormidium pseudopriestleyi FRX01 TaxID=1759528 RepID=A0ABS3FLG9_9CYAN|nr:hypothetical protein [Phormidium pseudopriestleyi]MBO0347878.1 hypothetical protein [Phormidium pseudopriestleyi FRX01]